MESPSEVAKLRRCLNDLVSVIALPGLWADKGAGQIASTVADALAGMLDLSCVLVRLNDPDGRPSLELMRGPGAAEAGGNENAFDFRETLTKRLGDHPNSWPPSLRMSGGKSDLYVATARLGIRGEIGGIAAVSERGFPDDSERLVLDVSANQAVVGLQHAFVLAEQRRLAEQLEDHVARGTRELAAANEQLKKSEGNLKLIIDRIPAFVWCMLPDGSNEFISKAWHAHTGVPPEASSGWGWMSVFHPDDLPGLMKKWQEVLAAGKPDETEARIRRHDGVYRWFLIRAEPFRDESGEIVRWYGTSTDIEDRKRAEEALVSRGQDLRMVIDTIPTLSWSTDARGFVEFLSRPWLDFTGLSEDQALGFGWAVAIHPDDANGLLHYWQSALEAGTPVDVEARLRRFDGAYRWFLFRANPLRDEAGTIIKWYGTNIEIEDRKRAEEALDKARSDLAHVSRIMSLSELTASIAHEVNQPLSGIITNAGTCMRMLDADPPNIDGARETVRRTIRDGNRASEVVTRLRALFSRGDFGPERTDLNEAAREVVTLSLSELQRNRVTVQMDLADDLPLIFADRVQLQQVILNLLRNASDAMVGVHDRPRHLLIRTRHEPNGNVCLSVRDAGVGLETHNLEKIFDSFYTTKVGGMGIGLSVSRSIIEKHHGRLWAEPNDGEGATFCFSIPRGTEPTK